MKINWNTTGRVSYPNGYQVSNKDIRAALLDEGIECRDSHKEISLTYHHPDAMQYAKGDKKIIYTMFESTKPPMYWKPHLETAEVIINPTEWGAETFRKRYGLDCEVVPLGYKSNHFTFRKRPPKRPVFTFVMYDVCKRKGFIEVWEAFRQEFDEDEPVRMIFKTADASIKFPPLWPHMQKITKIYSEQGLNKMLWNADCFVFPSRGEGFGHTPLEAMGTGLPVITLNAHGISSYFNEECMIGVDYEEIEAEYDYVPEDDLGLMVKADIDDLRRKMRWAYENVPKLRQMGVKAQKWASQWTWERTGKELSKIIRSL